MTKKISVYLVMLVMVIVLPLSGKPDVKFSGLFQTWFSYAPQLGSDDDGYGFTLRRMRLKPHGSLSKTVKWGFQVGWDGQRAAIYDAYLDFHMSKSFKLKVGQFAAPGTVSGALTSSAKLDLVERAMISQKWNGNSLLYGYRAMGIQAYGDLIEKKLSYSIMLANPSTTSLFTPKVSAPGYSHDLNGISVWARLEAKPVKGLRIGAFFGAGDMKAYEDENEYTTQSYGGHIFYVKDAINFKAEYIGGQYGQKDAETKYNGLYVLLGYKVSPKVEPIVRFDTYTPNDGDPGPLGVERFNNIGIGINYYHSKSIKLQANYIVRSETVGDGYEKPDNDIFYLCFQYTYK